MNKRNILEQALHQRNDEVLSYQIDIDNFARAIEKIGDDKDMQSFKEELQTLLKNATYEQRKATIIRDVIREQLEEANELRSSNQQ